MFCICCFQTFSVSSVLRIFNALRYLASYTQYAPTGIKLIRD